MCLPEILINGALSEAVFVFVRIGETSGCDSSGRLESQGCGGYLGCAGTPDKGFWDLRQHCNKIIIFTSQ